MAYNPIDNNEIQNGLTIDQSLLIKIKENFEAQQADLDARQNAINAINNKLLNQTLEQEIVLWSGNAYIDGTTNYNLWSSAQHRAWSYVKIYVAYDSQGRSGAGGHCFEINCGPNYAYNQDSHPYSVVCTTYGGEYRRLCVSTTGINIVDGVGAGWYLTKVVGVVKKQF